MRVSTLLGDRSGGQKAVISCNSVGNRESARLPRCQKSREQCCRRDFCAFLFARLIGRAPGRARPCSDPSGLGMEVPFRIQADLQETAQIAVFVRKCVSRCPDPQPTTTSVPSPATQACVGRRLLLLLTPCATLS